MTVTMVWQNNTTADGNGTSAMVLAVVLNIDAAHSIINIALDEEPMADTAHSIWPRSQTSMQYIASTIVPNIDTSTVQDAQQHCH